MRLERRLKIALAIVFCGTVRSLQAAEPVIEPAAAEAIEQLSTLYKSTRSYSDITTLSAARDKRAPAAVEIDFDFSAKIGWVRPNRVRAARVDARGIAHAASDGKTLWATQSRLKDTVVQRPVTTTAITDALREIGVGGMGTGFIVEGHGVEWLKRQGLTSLKMGSPSKVDGVAMRTVVAGITFPAGSPGPAGARTTVTFYIGSEDNLLRRVTHEYVSAKTRIGFLETHTNIRLDPDLPDSTFAFSPPEGAKPVETFAQVEPDERKPAIELGTLLPAFQVRDLKNKPVNAGDFKDKVLLIHFFAATDADTRAWPGAVKAGAQKTTVEPTSAGLPETVALYNQFKADGLQVVGVALDPRRDMVSQLTTKLAVPFPVIFEGKANDKSLSKLLGIRSLPSTIVVGRDGKIRQALGRGYEPGLEELLKALLANRVM